MPGNGVGYRGESGPDRVLAIEGRFELESPGIERPSLVGGGAWFVSEVVCVPQECVNRTHGPPLSGGSSKKLK